MRTRDARVVYLVLESATALLQATVWTTAAVYFISEAHLGPLQLVLLGTVMEVSILVFEIPTGIVADAVSRRRSVLLGTTLMGAALVLTGALPSFPALLGAQALWGLGYIFTSGATEAWSPARSATRRSARCSCAPPSTPAWPRRSASACRSGWPASSSGSRWWPPARSSWCWPAGWPWPCRRPAFGPSRESSGRPGATWPGPQATAWPRPAATGCCWPCWWSRCSPGCPPKASTGCGSCTCSARSGCPPSASSAR